MSRWINSFMNHPFQGVWQNLKEVTLEVEVDDTTVTTSVEEIARLKKIVSFLDSLISSCDPELVPESTWSNFHSQANVCLQQVSSYQSNRNIGHITNANSNLDNLLTYIRPYQVHSSDVTESVNSAYLSYSETISSSLTEFQEKSNMILGVIEEHKLQAASDAEASDVAKQRIEQLEKRYFDDTEEISVSTKISDLDTSIDTLFDKVQNYKSQLLDGDAHNESISSEIQRAFDEAESSSDSIKNLLREVEEKLVEFGNYHTRVFGKKNDEGKYEGGLKNEITAREAHLDTFKAQQETKYETLNREIESLLPGATSAGLASAYYDLKVSFDDAINNYTRLFYGSILALFLLAAISITQEVGFWFVKFVDVSDFTKLLPNILYKLPLLIPVLWLALFASKRRSESLRLQQEYAHKEALAKSYQNFKVQIEALDQEEPELMTKLLSAAIEAVAKNASDTLDKKHGDKTPAHEGIDGMITAIERMKKAVS